ncbi:MAG: type IV pilus secretin PilQ [Acidobacteriota bacterium]
MNKRRALLLTACFCMIAWQAAAATPASNLNQLSNLKAASQNGSVIVSVQGKYPILDYTYYDYDPETFVVDMADVDVSQLKKSLDVHEGAVSGVKVETVSRGKGRSLAKLEIHQAYLAKCLVSTSCNTLMVRVISSGASPAPVQAPPKTKAAAAPPSPAHAVSSEGAKAPESAPSANAPKADRITGVSVSGEGTRVTVQANGVPKVKYFTLKNPNRIVVDFPGVDRGHVPSKISGAGDIRRVRVSLFKADPPVTRVVLDLKKAVPEFSVQPTDGGVVVQVGSDRAGKETASAKAGSTKMAMEQAPASKSPAQHESAQTARRGEAAHGAEKSGAPRASAANETVRPAQSAASAAAEPAADVSRAKAGAAKMLQAGKPEKAADSLDHVKVNLKPLDAKASREFKGYGDLFVAQDSAPPAANGKTLVAGGVPLSFKEKTVSGGGVKYTGQPISLSLKDADIKDVLRLFHDISGMNIVVNPQVKGKVTVDLTNVPWDQAMDIILKNNGLDYVYENNVIWVAPAAEIARKFAEQQRLQEEQLKAEQPVTFTKRLSYAKAMDMKNIVKNFLSPKGQIFVDNRTNTMIIQEVPSRKAGILKLIDTLDTATPQVLIEARIVETNVNWQQNFGISWSGNWYTGPGASAATGGNTYSNGSPGGGGYPVHNFGTNGWPNFGSGDFAVNLPPPASNGFIDLMLGNLTGSFMLDVKLAALENTGRGRILSAPRVVTQDNEKATIESGRQIPIQIATADKISVVFVNATLKLEVTPQISADGNVNMKVDITNDSVDFEHQLPNSPPPILKKEARTTLKVMDGSTAVIGGIFVTNEGISQSGLPFLSKIPVLGWLFKNRTKSRTNDELLIFLTPKIIR